MQQDDKYKGFFSFCSVGQSGHKTRNRGALGREITVDEICDQNFRIQNAGKYIEEIKEHSTPNYPVENISDYDDFYFYIEKKRRDEEKLAQIDFWITVSNQKWIEHLKPGMSWGTASF